MTHNLLSRYHKISRYCPALWCPYRTGMHSITLLLVFFCIHIPVQNILDMCSSIFKCFLLWIGSSSTSRKPIQRSTSTAVSFTLKPCIHAVWWLLFSLAAVIFSTFVYSVHLNWNINLSVEHQQQKVVEMILALTSDLQVIPLQSRGNTWERFYKSSL